MAVGPDMVVNILDNWQKDKLSEEAVNTIWSLVMTDISRLNLSDSLVNTAVNEINNLSNSVIAILWYRIANYLFYQGKCNTARLMSEYIASTTSIDISPEARIGPGLLINHGNNLVIGSTCVIGNNCTLFNNVLLGSSTLNYGLDNNKHPTLGDNVTVCSGARILGNIKLGDNVFVSPNAVVTEDIPDNTRVTIVNQLQLSKNNTNKLTSQKLIVFGMRTKFKNTLIIYGIGFYNPTVLIKVKDKDLVYQIAYWDKNKIIIKFKYAKLTKKQVSRAKVVLLVASEKIILLNNYALEKCLLELTND